MGPKRKTKVKLDPIDRRRTHLWRRLMQVVNERISIGDNSPAARRLEQQERELRRQLDRLPRAA